jgi:hypothetical protein
MENDKTVDDLYERAFDILNRLSPTPMNDYKSIFGDHITIQFQALAADKFSVRLVGDDQARPFYVQGTKLEILYSLRQNIRNVLESNDKASTRITKIDGGFIIATPASDYPYSVGNSGGVDKALGSYGGYGYDPHEMPKSTTSAADLDRASKALETLDIDMKCPILPKGRP